MNQPANYFKSTQDTQKGKHQRNDSESGITLPWSKKTSEDHRKVNGVVEDSKKHLSKPKTKTIKNPKPQEDRESEDKLRSKKYWSMKTLLTTELPEPRWAIPDLLPIGLTFISGLPKAGKSWLGLQLAVSLCFGEEIFGIKVEKRKVLYLALEDGPRRLKDRLIAKGITTPGRVTFCLEWPLLEERGIDKLEAAIEKRGYDFIIIDTLSRACGKDQLKANEMVQVLGPLQKLAMKNNLAVVVIDHNSKSREGEPVLKLYGSIAKGGVADTIYDLTSNRITGKGLLRGVGRDIGNMADEVQIHLEWDDDVKSWKRVEAQQLAAYQLLKPGSFKEKVIQSMLRILSQGKLATCQSIADDLDKKSPFVSNTLNELCEANVIKKLPKEGAKQPYALIL
jgi:hypothetical protein